MDKQLRGEIEKLRFFAQQSDRLAVYTDLSFSTYKRRDFPEGSEWPFLFRRLWHSSQAPFSFPLQG